MLIFIYAATFVGCAWNNSDFKEDYRARPKSKKIKEFKLDDKIEKKFVIQPEVEVTPNVSAPASDGSSVAAKAPSKSAQKLKPSSAQTKPVNKIENVTNSDKKTIKYPGDKKYPKEFKKYDQLSADIWSKAEPVFFPGERMVLNIKYIGINFGKVSMTTKNSVKVGDKDCYYVYARMKSAPFYSYIYELDDIVESFIDQKTMLPARFVLTQRESRKDVDDLQLFDRDAFKTYFRYKRTKGGEVFQDSKDAYIPYFNQDSFSVVYFMRSLPLEVNDEYVFPITTKSKTWLVNAKVLTKEKIETKIGNFDAIKITAITKYDGELVRQGDIFFWFSDDKYRRFLKFEASTKIGKVYGEIEEYKKAQE